MTRIQVFQVTKGCDEGEAQPLADQTCPFVPELSYYHVFSVHKGTTCLLQGDACGTFTVLGNNPDHFRIVHESPPRVMLSSSDIAEPIYAIASGHSLDYKYKWDNVTSDLAGNTPVMWVNEPGSYRCTVTHNAKNAQCFSHVITVVCDRDSSSEPEVQITGIQMPSTSGINASASTSTHLVDGSVMTFTKEELERVTGNFSDDNMVGKGGFGKVYRGKLRCSDVAVKVLSNEGVQLLRAESSTQLKTEVAALTRFRHDNLLLLMGYCLEPPMLVYPFMMRKSLYDAGRS